MIHCTFISLTTNLKLNYFNKVFKSTCKFKSAHFNIFFPMLSFQQHIIFKIFVDYYKQKANNKEAKVYLLTIKYV